MRSSLAMGGVKCDLSNSAVGLKSGLKKPGGRIAGISRWRGCRRLEWNARRSDPWGASRAAADRSSEGACHRSSAPQLYGSPDGASPTGGTLLFDKEGNLYGTTLYGGAYGADHKGGTVWELTPSATLTILHNFELNENEIDGYGPDAGVVMDEKGNFYGTTYYGGTYGSGTVYEVNRDSWPLPPVYSSH
jgi:uncharacterized repeat protein (TIGR03803 family)